MLGSIIRLLVKPRLLASMPCLFAAETAAQNHVLKGSAKVEFEGVGELMFGPHDS